MKTKVTTHTIALISALTLSALGTVVVKAETSGATNTLIYNNRAYVHAIQSAPNPVADKTVQDAEIVYVDKANGQAIYGYPGNVAEQHTAFNVEYVDTAYGQATYSYPNNNPKHFLDLVDNSETSDNNFFVAATLRKGVVPAKVGGTTN
jgi:hypothetical protein